MITFYIAGAVLILAFAGLIFAGIFFYNVAVPRKYEEPEGFGDYFEKTLRGTEREYLLGEIKEGKRYYFEHPSEAAEITSRDGIKLRGKLFLCDGAEATFICVHGYRSAPYVDFPVMYRRLHREGYNVLVISCRAACDSDGDKITFGVKERFDVEDWCKFVRERLGERQKIVLFGLSMGAATVMMASELPFVNDSVSGIIADCGYTSPKEEFHHVIKWNYKLRPFPFVNVANIVCRIRAGWHFDEASAERAVKNTRVPILFIHGSADEFVPMRFTLDNYEACASRRELLIVDGAAHGFAFYASPDVYMAKMHEFIESVL